MLARKLTIVSACVLGALPAARAAQLPAAVRLNGPVERTIAFQTHSRQELTGPMIGEAPAKVEVQALLVMDELLAPQPSGALRVELSFRRQGLWFAHPAFERHLMHDTGADKPDAAAEKNTFERMLEPAIGRTLSFVVNERGEAASVAGFDEYLAAVDQSVGPDPLYRQMRSSFSEDAIKHGMVAARFALLPDKPVDVGATWERTTAVNDPHFGRVEYVATFTFESVDSSAGGSPVAVIRMEGQVRSAAGAEPPMSDRGFRPVLHRWTYSGATRLALDTGLVTEQQTTSRLRFDLKLAPAEGQEATTIEVQQEVAAEFQALPAGAAWQGTFPRAAGN